MQTLELTFAKSSDKNLLKMNSSPNPFPFLCNRDKYFARQFIGNADSQFVKMGGSARFYGWAVGHSWVTRTLEDYYIEAMRDKKRAFDMGA